jgi:hypothetical protein
LLFLYFLVIFYLFFLINWNANSTPSIFYFLYKRKMKEGELDPILSYSQPYYLFHRLYLFAQFITTYNKNPTFVALKHYNSTVCSYASITLRYLLCLYSSFHFFVSLFHLFFLFLRLIVVVLCLISVFRSLILLFTWNVFYLRGLVDTFVT